MSQAGPAFSAIELLEGAGVTMVIIGGTAASIHGASRRTYDIDFCCPRDQATFERLAVALNSVHARFRVEGLPEGMPTTLDARTFRSGEAFAFITDVGSIDVRFKVDGIGDYAAVLALSEEITIRERSIRLLSLDGLIASKRAMARPQDQLALPELEMMREARAVEAAERRDEQAPDVGLER